MTGTLYGIGIGPGDPELMTLKALRLIREADVIAVPGTVPQDTVAYKIVVQAYPQLAEKPLLPVEMPMTKDPVLLEKTHRAGADAVAQQLEAGKNVAFLTLGDPTVYSTYLYVHRIVASMGYAVEIVSGVPSFCAVAAKLNIGLVEQAEELHVIPASYRIDEALELPGTKVLMKAGKKMAAVKQTLAQQGKTAVMIENCGMENEHIYTSLEQIPDNAGYYSLMIVK